ncbi:MAG: sel1 repeat family protein [Paucibacter sp.]|nr:sel1 repeat family protein [Roseateles sp.]
MHLLRSLSAIVFFGVAATLAVADDSPYNKGVAAWKVQDYAEARKQWEKSLAEGGPDEALNNLAFLLFNGLGGDAEPSKAVELWRKGAALGVSEAQWHLGYALEEGRGIARDRTRALAWYLCAIASAKKQSASDPTERDIEQDAQDAESKLRSELSQAEVAEGNRIARQLISRYSSRLDTTQP